MPRRAHPKEVAERRDFSSGANASDLREMAADEIDETAADKIDPFVWIVEQLTHRDRHGTLLAQDFEVTNVFGSERVFEEEKTIGLKFFHETDGVDGRETFVGIVEQFDVIAELLAEVLE